MTREEPAEPLEPVHHVYTGWDRKDVEVLVDGTWYRGELRSWDRDTAGQWSGMVTWSAGPAQNYLERFPADRIRPDAQASAGTTDDRGST